MEDETDAQVDRVRVSLCFVHVSIPKCSPLLETRNRCMQKAWLLLADQQPLTPSSGLGRVDV